MSSAAFTEYPITEPVEPVRPTEVVTRLGKHGPWERIAAPLQHPYVRTAGRVGVAKIPGGIWTGLCWYGRSIEHSPAGLGRIGQSRVLRVLEDAAGAEHVDRLRGEVVAKEIRAREFDRRNRASGKDVCEDELAEAVTAWEAAKKASTDLEEARAKHNRQLCWRLVPTGAVALTALVAGLHEFLQLHAVVQATGGPAAVLGSPVALSRAGRPKVADLPSMRSRTRKRKSAAITDQLIGTAWAQMPLSKQGPLELLDAVQQLHDGSGWIVPAMLPGTLLVEDLEKVHGRFAKALGNRRRENVQIISDATQGEGFFYLQVIRKGEHERSVGASPLAQLTRTSIDEPVMLGADALGEARSIMLANANIFLGGMSQMGKSATVEQIIAWLMLNPAAVLHDVDLSSRPNYRRLWPLSSFTLCGMDRATLDRALAYLEWLDGERERRGTLLRQGTELSPLIVVLDELHELLMSRDHGTKAKILLERIARNCLGMNIHLVIATQRPDANSIPVGVMEQCGVRVGFHVEQSHTSDLIIPNDADTGEPVKLPRFTVEYVFDVSQTDGEPLPTVEDPELPDGAAPDGLIDAMGTLIERSGFSVTYTNNLPTGAHGQTSYTEGAVRIHADLPAAATAAVLAHELGHIRAEHETRRDAQGATRPQREAEADSIAYIVCAARGLDNLAFSAPYVAGWSAGDPAVVQAAFERVQRTSSAIVADVAELLDAPAGDVAEGDGAAAAAADGGGTRAA